MAYVFKNIYIQKGVELSVTDKNMKVHEYINIVHSTDAISLREVIFPQLVNAFWTSNGESYYPCILLEDTRDDAWAYIVTTNQTIMPHPRKCVFTLEEIEEESSHPIPMSAC